MSFRGIEISFPEPVEITGEDQQRLVSLIGEICDRYKETAPGRIMWPFGIGLKMLANPMMLSDDEPIPFDESVFAIDCSEREDFDFKCTKCGLPQGDHKTCIREPAAGDCDFSAASS